MQQDKIVQQFIISELKSAKLVVITQTHQASILCPWHNDHSPSLNIVLNHPTLPPGVFNCWACSASGNWNKLAEKLKLRKIAKVELAQTDPFYDLTDKFNAYFDTPTIVKLPPGLEEWVGDWRGLPERFLKSVGAYRWFDNQNEVYRILLPVYMGKELTGYIGGRLDNTTRPKYRNSIGKWAKNNWFGFDLPKSSIYVRNVWKLYNNSCVVITEGPYDTLRCLYNKIPTIALMGTNNWGSVKQSLLAALNIKTIVLFCQPGELLCPEAIPAPNKR